jgi:hypothetical protein
MNKQPGEDEKTELRCVKDSHASGEITRPMFWKLLAGRPVLGQPNWFTKALIRQIFTRPHFGRLRSGVAEGAGKLRRLLVPT